MTNRYYNESFSASLGQLAQSAALEAQYDGIERGFDLLQNDVDTLQGLTGITALSGFPASFAGAAGKYLAVNTAESAIEFISGGKMTIKVIGGTTYTLLATDANALLIFTNASDITVTVPPDVFDAGESTCLWQGNTGQVTVAPGAGVTLSSSGDLLKTRTQSAQIAVVAHGANAFGVIGDRNASAAATAIQMSCSDLTTALATGTNKAYCRAPHALTITDIRASLLTASSSGAVTIDVNKNGSTILSTKLTIDANEKTSETAATPAVLTSTALADDDEITVDIDGAGTGAAGLILTITGTFA